MTAEKEIVPSWVHGMADYCLMFDLQEADLKRALLDFPAGVSSFNAQMHEKGYKVCSGDPSYDLSLSKMKELSERVFQANQDYLSAHQHILKKSDHIDSILADWQDNLTLFLKDYEQGLSDERYQFMKLPTFPFDDHVFDIALCSDHLFQQHKTSLAKQERVIEELSRVAKEVRVFPLLDSQGDIAESLGHVMQNFQQKGYGMEVREVSYHHLKGANAMLRLWSTECVVET